MAWLKISITKKLLKKRAQSVASRNFLLPGFNTLRCFHRLIAVLRCWYEQKSTSETAALPYVSYGSSWEIFVLRYENPP